MGVNPNHRAVSGVKYEGVYAGGNTGAALLTAPATDLARQWDGWGTALKPALEPIVLARKPLSERTVAANLARWGTGALNIDSCRIEATDNVTFDRSAGDRSREQYRTGTCVGGAKRAAGRWPVSTGHRALYRMLPRTGLCSAVCC